MEFFFIMHIKWYIIVWCMIIIIVDLRFFFEFVNKVLKLKKKKKK